MDLAARIKVYLLEFIHEYLQGFLSKVLEVLHVKKSILFVLDPVVVIVLGLLP